MAKILQVDRNAAADWIQQNWAQVGVDRQRVMDAHVRIRSGDWDNHTMVVAFARHREAAIFCQTCEGSGERIFNRHPSRDPLYDEGVACSDCSGTGQAKSKPLPPIDPDIMLGGHDNPREKCFS